MQLLGSQPYLNMALTKSGLGARRRRIRLGGIDHPLCYQEWRRTERNRRKSTIYAATQARGRGIPGQGRRKSKERGGDIPRELEKNVAVSASTGGIPPGGKRGGKEEEREMFIEVGGIFTSVTPGEGLLRFSILLQRPQAHTRREAKTSSVEGHWD